MAKILLIDDDPDIRMVMGRMLKNEGYEVETASRRDEALEILQKQTPSIILLDVLLSGSDGRELCREIKANQATKHVPVIMLSGHPGAAQQFETYGANDFISKPIQSESLLEKLSRQIASLK